MAWYVGLTDDPDRRKTEHGNPADWQQTRFTSEDAARAWEHSYAQNALVVRNESYG
jgi:predicted GIY-YIG superfamily endonuclease